MSDLFKTTPLGVPAYIPPAKAEIDVAEFSALRTIVIALVADTALSNHLVHGVNAQRWINDLSARCQESIIAGEIIVGNDREAGERLKARVLEQINAILGSIKITINPD